MQPALYAPLAALALGWLWFLARGRAPGATKRIALRGTLLALVAALVAAGAHRGVFARSSIGFRLALLAALLSVVGGYLYLVRFCSACGRMERDLQVARCRRCAALLPRHGMTAGLRREDAEDTAPRAPRPRAKRR